MTWTRSGSAPGTGIFSPRKLADTQFGDLEMPGPAENALVIPADGTPEELVAAIIAGLHLAAAPGD